LLQSAERYPPALALAVADLRRAGDPGWGPATISTRLVGALRRHLRAQSRKPFVLAEARASETGYLTRGEFYWILEYLKRSTSGRPLVRWVSDDFNVYVNPASDFKLTKGLRGRLAPAASSRRTQRGLTGR
jgi:hypothetical protein